MTILPSWGSEQDRDLSDAGDERAFTPPPSDPHHVLMDGQWGRGVSAPIVRRAGPADADEVTAILAEAAADDRGLAWVFGTMQAYRRLAPAFFRQATQSALDAGYVYVVDGRAAWLGLPSSALETRPEHVRAEIEQLRMGAEYAERLLALETICRRHHPMHTPHWYDHWMGVRPAHRGQGLAVLLRRHTLEHHPDLPHFNEAWPDVAPLWEKTGFRSIRRLEIAEGMTIVQQVGPADFAKTVGRPVSEW